MGTNAETYVEQLNFNFLIYCAKLPCVLMTNDTVSISILYPTI